MKRLGLIGFSGCGKSSLLNLAGAEGFRTVDTDSVAEKSMKIGDLILDGRESEFRELEKSVIRDALAADNDMIAFGGGVHTGHIAWKDIEDSDLKLIFLKQSFERCLERAFDRPLLKKLGACGYRKLFDERQKMYAEATQYSVNVGNKPLNVIWKEVKVLWN